MLSLRSVVVEKKEKSKDSKLSKKILKTALDEEQESADSGGGLQKLDEGTLKFAVCTGVLASRKDSKDIKVPCRHDHQLPSLR